MKISLLLQSICLLLLHITRFELCSKLKNWISHFVEKLQGYLHWYQFWGKVSNSFFHHIKLFSITIFLFDIPFLQPSFIIAIFALEENTEDHLSIGDAKLQKKETSPTTVVSKRSSLVDALMHYIERADDLIKRFKHTVLCT